MKAARITPLALAGKVIDIHAHVGLSLKAYACVEFPYAQTLEGLYYRQLAGGVDVNVVFPYAPDLFFDPHRLVEGEAVPAARPLSPIPYGTENRMLLTEVYSFCPELRERFIPFISADPARMVSEQVRDWERLEKDFPIYGIKIVPVLCQSSVTELLGRGRDILAFARERDLPLLLHTTTDPDEAYSRVDLTFLVVEANPDLRFCLAHCIGFDGRYLELVDKMPNVWFDTGALKIQVQLVFEGCPVMAQPPRRFEADYSDHKKVMLALARRFPDSIIWGTDSPAYSYICRRKQAEGKFGEFRLKGLYEDEVDALNALPPDLRTKACNANSIRFLFGAEGPLSTKESNARSAKKVHGGTKRPRSSRK